LLGLVKQIPIAKFHRLVPCAVLGFAINAGSGTFFLMTDPDQYVYNSAFHLKGAVSDTCRSQRSPLLPHHVSPGETTRAWRAGTRICQAERSDFLGPVDDCDRGWPDDHVLPADRVSLRSADRLLGQLHSEVVIQQMR
jgi:hypothetical protein